MPIRAFYLANVGGGTPLNLVSLGLMSPILQTGSRIASAIFTFGALIVATAIVAFVVARVYGGESRRKRQAIVASVGSVGLLAAAIVTYFRLRSPSK